MTEAERQQMSEAFREWERVIKREVADIERATDLRRKNWRKP